MSWRTLKINQICTIVRGSSPRPKGDPRYYGGSVPRLMIEDVTRDRKYVTPTTDFLTYEGALLSRPMRKGELVITVSGKTGVPAILAVDACVHDGFVGFRELSSTISVEYLYHYLASLTERTNAKSVGAIFKNLTTDQIKEIDIPVPPLHIQQQIADTLDKADALRQKDQQLLKKYDELAQSIFYNMFGDPYINDKHWNISTLGGLAGKQKYSLKRGPFGGALKKEIFKQHGYLVYEQYHAINDLYDLARYFIDEEKYEELKMFAVEPGDLIVSCSGVTLGRISEIPKSALPGIINQALLKITLNKEVITNDFFIYQFRGKKVQSKLFETSRGSGIPNFPPMEQVRSLKFVLPPLKMQQQFTEIYQSIQKQKQMCTIDETEKLMNSLIFNAFD